MLAMRRKNVRRTNVVVIHIANLLAGHGDRYNGLYCSIGEDSVDLAEGQLQMNVRVCGPCNLSFYRLAVFSCRPPS